MDFTLAILTGLCGVAGGLFVGSELRKFTVSRLTVWFQAQINAYVAGFLQNLQDNPEQAEALVRPFIDAVMKQLQGPATTKEGSLKIAGIPIPKSLIADLMKMFIGKYAKTPQDSNSLLQLPS